MSTNDMSEISNASRRRSNLVKSLSSGNSTSRSSDTKSLSCTKPQKSYANIAGGISLNPVDTTLPIFMIHFPEHRWPLYTFKDMNTSIAGMIVNDLETIMPVDLKSSNGRFLIIIPLDYDFPSAISQCDEDSRDLVSYVLIDSINDSYNVEPNCIYIRTQECKGVCPSIPHLLLDMDLPSLFCNVNLNDYLISVIETMPSRRLRNGGLWCYDLWLKLYGTFILNPNISKDNILNKRCAFIYLLSVLHLKLKQGYSIHCSEHQNVTIVRVDRIKQCGIWIGDDHVGEYSYCLSKVYEKKCSNCLLLKLIIDIQLDMPVVEPVISIERIRVMELFHSVWRYVGNLALARSGGILDASVLKIVDFSSATREVVDILKNRIESDTNPPIQVAKYKHDQGSARMCIQVPQYIVDAGDVINRVRIYVAECVMVNFGRLNLSGIIEFTLERAPLNSGMTILIRTDLNVITVMPYVTKLITKEWSGDSRLNNTFEVRGTVTPVNNNAFIDLYMHHFFLTLAAHLIRIVRAENKGIAYNLTFQRLMNDKRYSMRTSDIKATIRAFRVVWGTIDAQVSIHIDTMIGLLNDPSCVEDSIYDRLTIDMVFKAFVPLFPINKSSDKSLVSSTNASQNMTPVVIAFPRLIVPVKQYMLKYSETNSDVLDIHLNPEEIAEAALTEFCDKLKSSDHNKVLAHLTSNINLDEKETSDDTIRKKRDKNVQYKKKNSHAVNNVDVDVYDDGQSSSSATAFEVVSHKMSDKCVTEGVSNWTEVCNLEDLA